MTTLIHKSTQRARKRHQCDACLAPILPGDLYARERYADGSDVWTWRTHAECDAEISNQRAGYDDVFDQGCLVDGTLEELSAEWLAWFHGRKEVQP